MSASNRSVSLRVVVGVLCALLGAFVLQAQAAECPQITSWSGQDTVFFPVPYKVTRTERNNTPGPNYIDLNNVQEKVLRSTYFVMSAGPSLSKDQTFDNSIGVSLFSFASEADAKTMFLREWDLFFRLNDVRWGYEIVQAEHGVGLEWYQSYAGEQQVTLLVLHKNTLIQITLSSATSAETKVDGHAALGPRLQRARDLIDARCSGRGDIFSPSVYLDAWGGPSFQSAFQRRLAGGSLKIVATDQNGREDLDWSTFRLFVAGIDKTGHALQVVNRLAAAGRVTHGLPDDQPYLESYEFRLDPAELAGAHNFFNIEFNGVWPVQLRICDRKGQCGQTDYKLYFGPFLIVESFNDRRCEGSWGSDQVRFTATLGNHGRTSFANLYVALSPSLTPWEGWTGNFWTLSQDMPTADGNLQWMHASYGIQTVFSAKPMVLPTGALIADHPLVTSALGWVSGNRVPLGGGSHSLAYGAVDMSPGLGEGSYLIERSVVRLCAR